MGSGVVDASQNFSFSSDGFLPEISLSLEDLDARDANNQPLTSRAASEELTDLFRSSLFYLITRADLYSLARALSVIKKKLNLGALALAGRLPAVARERVNAVLPSKKQWDRILVCLSILITLPLTVVPFLLFSLRRLPASPITIPVVFRC